MINNLKTVCVIVPAYNEERVIVNTLTTLKSIFAPEEIYVVDDGSKDNTGKVARKHVPNVLNLGQNIGKAAATNAVIKYFSLTKKYKYIVFMDSDTVISPSFMQHVLPIFDKDVDEEITVIMGRVTSTKYNWITSYRTWEYEIAQTFHKSAQDKTNTILVSPGCSSIYRSKIFDVLDVPQGTLAEDMDLTFAIHRNKLGKVLYEGKAKVTTQDPRTLQEFAKQIDRWYTGFWQCVVKHNIPWEGQRLDFEVALLALEGLFNGLLVLSLFLLIPLALLKNPYILIFPLAIDLFLFLLPSILYVLIKYKHPKLLLHLPSFYIIRALSSFVFIKSFFKVLFNLDRRMSWFKVFRYGVN